MYGRVEAGIPLANQEQAFVSREACAKRQPAQLGEKSVTEFYT